MSRSRKTELFQFIFSNFPSTLIIALGVSAIHMVRLDQDIRLQGAYMEDDLEPTVHVSISNIRRTIKPLRWMGYRAIASTLAVLS